MDENGGLAMKTGGSMCFNHLPLGFYHQQVRVEIGFHRENAETLHEQFGKHANTGITAEETMASMILTKRKLAFFDKQKGELAKDSSPCQEFRAACRIYGYDAEVMGCHGSW